MIAIVGNWWAFVIRGVLAVLFGLLTLVLPGIALLTLVFLFGIYAISDGVFNIMAAFRTATAKEQPWWALLISGIFGLIAGVLAFFLPGLTALALLYLIAAWAVVTGIMTVVAAVRLRKKIHGEWLLAITGVLSIALGVLAALFPGPGALAVVLWIGAYAMVLGVLLIVLGFKLRKLIRNVEHPPADDLRSVAPSH